METQDLAPPARAGKVTTENHRPGDGETDVAHLRDLIDGIDAVVYEVDSHGWVHFVNRRAVELFGYPQERWLSQPSFWHAITYHDDRPKVRAHFYQCVRYSQRRHLEYRIVAVDGRIIWVRESLRASRDTLHGTRLLRGVMWKIHPGRKAGEPLSLARQQLTEQLADMAQPRNLSQPLWSTADLEPLLEEILTATASIQGAAMGMVRVCDQARHDLQIVASIGVPRAYLERYDRVPQNDVACGLAIERGSSLIIEDVGAEEISSPYREPARIAGYRATFSTLLMSRAGELLGTIATCFREPHRPTEREVRIVELFARQATDFLENARLRRALQEADRRKDDALAALAHELRNPLSVIVNAAHVTKATKSDDLQTVQFCTLVGRQARFMARLAGDLIAMSRPAPVETELQFESVDVRSCMESAAESVRMIVEARHQELTLVSPLEPITLKADSIRLQQILVNLLINASRCTQAGGQITLQANEEGGAVVFRARDTGVGIPPEIVNRIFDPYVRGDLQAWPEGNSLGLGLTLVKKFVERHHGTVAAHSAGMGMGSEFVVRLPWDWAETTDEPLVPRLRRRP